MPSRHKLPPGPPGWPLLGNISDIPIVSPWLGYTELAKKYGGIVGFKVLGQNLVVINDIEIARQILDKKSSITSDRPANKLLDFLGWEFSLVILRYGQRWRAQRRLFHQAFRPEAVLSYRPVIASKAKQLLLNLLQSPEAFIDHARNYPASIVMQLVYGHQIAPRNDRLVYLADKAGEMVMLLLLPDRDIIKIFPFLRLLPEWFPFISFPRKARTSREMVKEMRDVPWDMVKNGIAAGTASPSMAADLLARSSKTDEDINEREDTIKDTVSIAFAAGTDTTAATLKTFMLAMLLFPDVQRKAQDEIDRVIGRGRLPTFEDRDSLPYIQAIHHETQRWHPSVLLSFPHVATEDVSYDGYTLPKGTIILPNVWAMSRNENTYFDAEKFDPGRYLSPSGELTDANAEFTFGFGRRICPGRHAADATLWLAISTILAVFRIEKAKDENGCEIPVTGDYGGEGLVGHVVPYKCVFAPRHEDAAKLVSSM
ncbi:cytochrome P450 [Laetiporus sulphureus 93-53]|uniref:Cytochrome P450 n=1 Tax=Laetiporus sulphureus 93-53 TaxID=1314785 RepID=A0A165DHG3_9APHY|nr:cytochrome P450 [Laetiporus sulphureus 93-53]KZT04888.1 cytochrome P450 [Laetiporus sulphureus 93-53]